MRRQWGFTSICTVVKMWPWSKSWPSTFYSLIADHTNCRLMNVNCDLWPFYGSMEEVAWPQNQRLRWLAHEPASYMTHSVPCNGLHVTESSVGTSLTSSLKPVVWGTLIVDKPLKICLDCWLYTLTVVTVVTTVGMRVEEVQHKLCQHINKWCQVILIARIVAKLLHSIVYQCIIMGIESF